MMSISSTVKSGSLGEAPELEDRVLKSYKSAIRPRRDCYAHPSLPPYGWASLEPLGAPGLGATAISYTWACCQEMPLTSNQSSPMSLETYETAVMAVSPNPGAPSGSKDDQPYGREEVRA